MAFPVAARSTNHLIMRISIHGFVVSYWNNPWDLLQSYHLWQNEFIEEFFELSGCTVVGEFVEQPPQVLALYVGSGEGDEKVVACLSRRDTQIFVESFQETSDKLASRISAT